MRKLGRLIEQILPHLAELETLDTGLPIHQTKNVLIPRALRITRLFCEVCTRMDRHSYPVDDQMLNYTLYQPVGVCGPGSPWNVPFMTATWKTAPCLALGNAAVPENVRAVAADRKRTGSPWPSKRAFPRVY